MRDRLRTYIQHQHPFADTFTDQDFEDFSYITVEDGPTLAALVWLSWWARADRVLELHAAALPAYRGRWLTAQVVRQLFAAREVMRPRVLIAQAYNDKISAIWERLGFERIGHYYVSKEE